MSPRRKLLFGALGALLIIAVGVAVVVFDREALDDQRVPVLLVHGFGSSSESMSIVAGALRNAGREVVAVDLPERGEGDISESARALAETVDATRAARVDVVAHSAGGVVTRAWLKDFDGTERARRIITLGSPHHGAEVADFAAAAGPEACIDACAQLGRQSSFMSELNSGDETPGRDTFYASIWTQFDDTVTPPDSAVLSGAMNIRVQDVCSGVQLSHGDLIRDPVTIGMVISLLTRNSEDTFGPSDCSSLRMVGLDALSS